MKIKVSKATGPALDWMVAKAIGDYKPVAVPAYSTDWAQGGPIIEREGIATEPWNLTHPWRAMMADGDFEVYGSSPLIAAMRAYVASKLGDEVDVPEGL